MVLTWEEYLQLAAVVTNLNESIYYFDDEKIEIKEKNRRVAAAAKKYHEFFNELKYLKFMEEVRISLTQMCKKNVTIILRVRNTLVGFISLTHNYFNLCKENPSKCFSKIMTSN